VNIASLAGDARSPSATTASIGSGALVTRIVNGASNSYHDTNAQTVVVAVVSSSRPVELRARRRPQTRLTPSRSRGTHKTSPYGAGLTLARHTRAKPPRAP